MRIMVIYGNPKSAGFVHGCLDHIADRLEQSGEQVDRLRLHDAGLKDCVGCFTCLRTGECPLEDDVAEIVERMRAADGFVVGASVRNGFFPALYKRFYERITYPVGFTRDLKDKHVLAIGAVGLGGGKRNLGFVLTFKEFQTCIVDFLHFRVGMPGRIRPEDARLKLDRACERFRDAVRNRKRRPILSCLSGSVDDFVIRKFMLDRNEKHTFDYVIAEWQRKGLLAGTSAPRERPNGPSGS